MIEFKLETKKLYKLNDDQLGFKSFYTKLVKEEQGILKNKR